MDRNKYELSTLNEDVIVDNKFLKTLDDYPSKLSEEIVSLISSEAGLTSSDPRVLKLLSIVSQQFIEEMVSGTAESIISKKNNNKFLEMKELVEVIKEKGFNSNKSQFYCDNLNFNLDKYK